MQAAYNLNSNELNINFLNSIKEMFQNKNIEIIISENKNKNEFEENSDTLHKRLNDYKNNPNSFLPVDDEFWKDTKTRLKERYQKAI